VFCSIDVSPELKRLTRFYQQQSTDCRLILLSDDCPALSLQLHICNRDEGQQGGDIARASRACWRLMIRSRNINMLNKPYLDYVVVMFATAWSNGPSLDSVRGQMAAAD
jgi:hypothetical protein